MKPEKQRKRGWQFPDPIDGYDLVCVCFKIPDHQLYRTAFRGALQTLAEWWHWENDYTPGDTRQTQVARYWKALIQEHLQMGTCDNFQLRQNPLNVCQLEQSFDGGETWSTAYDYSLCAPIDPLSRYNPDSTHLEYSTDGGASWFDASAFDPRFTTPSAPPPTGGDVACKVAQNIVALLQDIIQQMIDALSAGATFLTLAALVGGIIAILVSGGAAIPLMAGLLSFVLNTTSSALAAAFTPELWDEFTCLLIAYQNEEHQFDGGWDGLMADLQPRTVGNIAWTVLRGLVSLLGPAGLNNAAASGNADGAGCVCECLSYDFNWGAGNPADVSAWTVATLADFPAGPGVSGPNASGFSFNLEPTPAPGNITGGGYTNGTTPYTQTGAWTAVDFGGCLLSQIAVTWRQNAVSNHSSGCNIWVYRGGAWEFAAATEGVQNSFIRRVVNVSLSGVTRIAIFPVSEKPNLVSRVEFVFS